MIFEWTFPDLQFVFDLLCNCHLSVTLSLWSKHSATFQFDFLCSCLESISHNFFLIFSTSLSKHPAEFECDIVWDCCLSVFHTLSLSASLTLISILSSIITLVSPFCDCYVNVSCTLRLLSWFPAQFVFDPLWDRSVIMWRILRLIPALCDCYRSISSMLNLFPSSFAAQVFRVSWF